MAADGLIKALLIIGYLKFLNQLNIEPLIL
jgi:hypothetical protein